MVTTSAWRVPRRVGASTVETRSEAPGRTRTRWRVGDGLREGGHASRTSRFMWRFVVFVSRR